MSHKLLIGTTIFAVVILVFAWVSLPTAPAEPAPLAASPEAPAPTPVISAPAPTATPSGYTMAQVQSHGNANSCWSVINNKVYDLTSWINQHPGGSQAILSICGADGTSAFDSQHNGDRRATSELANFYIGPLTH